MSGSDQTVGLTVTWPVFMSCSFLIRFFSIKSHYERYNQLCLKPIIQFNLAWRCRDILRLEMAELFHNKVTRRVIREERKIMRHLKNMHAVVHMCTFLWDVRAGVYTNQTNRFPSNALFFYWKRLSEKALEGTLSEWKYWQYAFTPPCHYGHDVKTRSQVWQVEGLSNWDCSCELNVIEKPVPGT